MTALNIQSVLSPNHFDGRAGYDPSWIILHGTAGGSSALNIANFFADPASQVSSNYVVGLAGEIICCVDESNASWANGPISGPPGVGGDGIHHDSWWDTAAPNPNYVTISIEHVKLHDDNSDTLTPAQQASSFALVLDICKRNGIPMRAANASGGITGHFSMDPVNRSRCPGTYPWAALWTYLGGNAVTTPNKYQVADAAAEWQTTAMLFPGNKAPSYTTGIAQAWAARVYQGSRLGPPLTGELDGTDWGGNAIKVQQFLHARCEWRVDGSSCRFFDGRGEIV